MPQNGECWKEASSGEGLKSPLNTLNLRCLGDIQMTMSTGQLDTRMLKLTGAQNRLKTGVYEDGN